MLSSVDCIGKIPWSIIFALATYFLLLLFPPNVELMWCLAGFWVFLVDLVKRVTPPFSAGTTPTALLLVSMCLPTGIAPFAYLVVGETGVLGLH